MMNLLYQIENMRTIRISIFCLFAVCIATSSIPLLQPLTIDLTQTNIVSSADQVRVKLKVNGGVSPYTLIYQNLPPGCFNTQVYLFFEKTESGPYYQTGIRVSAEDAIGSTIRVTLMIIMNGVNVFLDNTLYPYELSLQDGFLVENQASGSTLQEKLKTLISESQQGFIIPYQTLDQSYSELPNLEELQQIILTNNLLALIKTINAVANTKLNCVQKIGYLSELGSRIYSIYFIKQSELQRMRNQLIKKESQLQLLKDSMQKLEKEKDGESDENLEEKLQRKLLKLENAYSLYNFYTAGKEQILEQIVLLKIQKTKMNQQYDSLRFRITEIRMLLATNPSLQQQEVLTQQLEQRWAKAQQIRQSVEEINRGIGRKEEQLDIIRNKADQLKTAYRLLEVEIQAMQKQLYDPVELEELISSNNESLNSEITQFNELKQKYESLASYIRVIENSLTTVQENIDSLYYQCYGVQNKYSNISPQLVVYTFSYHDFTNYVKQVYGVTAGSALVGSPDKITLTRTNVLSSIWTNNFGNSLQDPNFNVLSNNFSCLGSEELKSRVSMIRKIEGNALEVWSQGEGFQYLLLGACTRIQMAFQTPGAGSLAFWRGTASYRQVFDVYFMFIL